MTNRFLKALLGVVLIIGGLGIIIGAIKFSRGDTVTVTQGMNPCSEAMLIFGMIVGIYGIYLIYAGWNPEEAAKLAQPKAPVQPPAIPTEDETKPPSLP